MNLREITETSWVVLVRSPKACNLVRIAKSGASMADFVNKYLYDFQPGDISGPNGRYICKENFPYILFLTPVG